MAPPRKPSEPGRLHSIFVRLTPPVFQRIEAKAKAEGRPMNRIIMDELTAYPQLAGQAQFSTLLRAMENTLQHYGSRIVLADLGEQLFRAVDHALEAKSEGQLQARLDGLRVLRSAMLRHERAAADWVLSETTPTGAFEMDVKVEGAAPDHAEPVTEAKPRRSLVAAKRT